MGIWQKRKKFEEKTVTGKGQRGHAVVVRGVAVCESGGEWLLKLLEV